MATTKQKDCNKSFAEEHNQLIDDVAFLSCVSGGDFLDKFVQVSDSDSKSATTKHRQQNQIINTIFNKPTMYNY